MRANTRRDLRFAFDDAADAYDRGRAPMPAWVASTILDWCGLRPGDRVLEVGAGTGQLTGPLLAHDVSIVAIEPGARLAEHLRSNNPTGLDVVTTTFEAFATEERFAAVAAANSFHWIDPAVSYVRTAQLLRPGGRLALVWSFPVVADAGLQRRLNDAFPGDLADLRRDPDTHLDNAWQSLADGRREMAASGCFEPPQWSLTVQQESWTVTAYADFLTSLANGAGSAAAIADAVGSVLDAPDVGMTNHIYVCASRAAGVGR